VIRASIGATGRLARAKWGINAPMSGSLITLPLRAGLKATELTLRGAHDIVRRAAEAVGLAPERTPAPAEYAEYAEGPPTEREAEAPAEAEVAPAPPEAEVVPAPPEAAVAPAPPEAEVVPTPPEAEVVPTPPEAEVVQEPRFTADYDTPAPVEPVHVSQDAELVEEVAEAGAEDGAGAQVNVAEPWDGYRQLKAADVIDRLSGASSEELAAIELFELFGRKRRTVIAAAQRELSRRG
jgi:outer membrane biosynthesis protein TonB